VVVGPAVVVGTAEVVVAKGAAEVLGTAVVVAGAAEVVGSAEVVAGAAEVLGEEVVMIVWAVVGVSTTDGAGEMICVDRVVSFGVLRR
jgi:hypothetical protein